MTHSHRLTPLLALALGIGACTGAGNLSTTSDDAGPIPLEDAGPRSPMDAGPSSTSDAGPTASEDAGSSSPSDAGPMSSADAGAPDSDGDGTPDSEDECPGDAARVEPGPCGCGVSDGGCESVPQTLALPPGADAYVDAASPDANFGLEPTLLVDGAPDVFESMLRFEVPTLTAPLQSVVLRLRVTDPSPNGLSVYLTTDPWTEEGVTWNDRPAPGGEAIAERAEVTSGWLEIDVTEAVAGAGEVSFLLVAGGDDGVDMDSREGTDPPELVVITGEPGEGITHVGTTESYDGNGQGMTIDRPGGSMEGDLLVLVLHRTDDDLPLYVDGWTRVAECYKGDNPDDCGVEADCTSWHDADFCADFGAAGDGHDLAQSIFYRVVGPEEQSSYTFDLNRDTSGKPGWAILTALRGARTVAPVRAWSNTGCDGDADSIFPSVYGEVGDMVLLSQSFDDAIAEANFLAPAGTESLGYVSESDEAGFLFGGVLTSTGDTGPMETTGPGGPPCKDALVSLTIVPR